MVERRVNRLQLRGADAQDLPRLLPRLEDALRCASLPGDGGALLLVRRLALGRIPGAATAQQLGARLEQGLQRLARSDGAAAAAMATEQADCVVFDSLLDACCALSLRLLRGQDCRAWYWRLVVPGALDAPGPPQALRRVAQALAQRPEAATALPAWARVLVQAGGGPVLRQAVGDEPLRRWLAVVPGAVGAGDGGLAQDGAGAVDGDDAPGVAQVALPVQLPGVLAAEHGIGQGSTGGTLASPGAGSSEIASRPQLERSGHVDAALAGSPARRAAAGPPAPAADPHADGLGGREWPPDRATASTGVHGPAGVADRSTRPHPASGSDAAMRPPRRATDGPASATSASRVSAMAPTPGGPATLTTGRTGGGRTRSDEAAGRPRAGDAIGNPHEDDAATIARAEPATLLRAGEPPHPPPHPGPASDAPRVWHPAPAPGVATAWGGLLFLLPLLARLGWPAHRAAVAAAAADVASTLADPVVATATLLAAARARVAGCDRGCDADDPMHALLVAARPADDDTQVWLRRVRHTLRREAGIGLASLLRRPARLQLTTTHVDLHFRLDALDLRVRRAGLDIDPGWLPWFGRVVAFHYDRGDDAGGDNGRRGP